MAIIAAAAIGALGLIAYRIHTQQDGSQNLNPNKITEDKTTRVYKEAMDAYPLEGTDASELDENFPIQAREPVGYTQGLSTKSKLSEQDEQDTYALDDTDASELDDSFPIQAREPVGYTQGLPTQPIASEQDKQDVYALEGTDASKLDEDFPIHEERIPLRVQGEKDSVGKHFEIFGGIS